MEGRVSQCLMFVSQARVLYKTYTFSLANGLQVNRRPQNLKVNFREVRKKNLFSIKKRMYLEFCTICPLSYFFLSSFLFSKTILLLLYFITCFSCLLLYSIPSGCPASSVSSIQDCISVLNQLSCDTFTIRPHGSQNTGLYTHIKIPVVLVAHILTHLQLSYGNQAPTVLLR